MDISWSLRKLDSYVEKNFVTEVYLNPKLEKYLQTIVSSMIIDLSYCNLIDSDVSMIVKNVFSSEEKNRILDLSGNRLTSQSAAILAKHLTKSSSIKSLDLSFNRLNDSGIRPLAEIFAENPQLSLRKVFLNKNGITNIGARNLSNLLRTNRTIEELWLSDNEIGDLGVEHLTHVVAFCNKTLKVLVLSSNIFITDRSISFILKLFKFNKTLEKLFLRDCNLTEIGKDLLCNEIRSKKNFHLDI